MRKISLFALLLFGCVVAIAQTVNSSKTKSSAVSFGIKGGVNFADYFRDNFPQGAKPGMGWSTSFHSGLTMNAPLHKKMLSLQPELLYTGAGSKLSLDRPGAQPFDYEQRFHYLSLPVVLQWKDERGFLAETGPVPAYLLKAKQIGPSDYKTDDKSSFNKFDMSWAVGIGYMSATGLGIGIRYNYGLTNVLSENTGSFYPANATLHNSVIQAGLSWCFSANKRLIL